MHHAQIAQRAFDTPLMIAPAKALAFLAGLGPRITGQEIRFDGMTVAEPDLTATRQTAFASLIGGDLAQRHGGDTDAPFPIIDGVAVIAIAGTLVHRGAWIGQSSGLTSYEGLTAQLDAAVSDNTIRGIALEIDSFGGEVAGAFDLADRIRAARDIKPVHAFLAEHALSAGYALASQADHITLPRTGAAGSIGVITMHTDMSGMLAQKGVAVTLIHAGARKADGNPYAALPEGIRGRLQAELEDLRILFAETVAAGRGDRMTKDAALATEAAVFRGAVAVDAGLADAVADPRVAFRAFANGLSRPALPVGRPAKSPTLSPPHPKQEMIMSDQTDEDARTPDQQIPQTATPIAPNTPPQAATPTAQEPPAPGAAPAAAPTDADAIRAEAAEVASICAQAAKLGVTLDAADAVRRGVSPDALRGQILDSLAARSDASGILASAPAPTDRPSPLVAAARKSADSAQR
ncbi:MAG: S49 family peptidase [Alterinioella nitratireducens]|uniref:S49 family peptidase n=1 Tax=Alterinioella nitratireducens TaxID=2735915 RepID=UPI0025FB53A3|nr:S49 family peptidase [Paracoccus sp. UBA889]|tara:strand:- start:4503 stop:5894 length:1392 start_codon:yes stop_codon:yes gene_type:complete